MIRAVAVALVVGLSGAPAARAELPGPGAGPGPFDVCEERMITAPDAPSSPACFYSVAIQTGLREEGLRRVEAHRVRSPDSPGILLAMANLESDLARPTTEARYREAMARFRAAGPAKGVIFAALNLSNYLLRHRKLDEASAVIDEAEQAAIDAGDRAMTLATRTVKARLLWQEGMDLGRAHRILASIEDEVLAGPEPIAKQQLLQLLGAVSAGLGRYADAIDAYRREAEISAAAGDARLRIGAMLRMASTTMTMIKDAPRDARADALIAQLEEILDLSIATQNTYPEAYARELLASLERADLAAAEAHLARCVAISVELDDPPMRARCLLTRGQLEARRDPQLGFRTLDEAVAISRRVGEPGGIADALAVRASARWKHGAREDALAATTEALDAIEAVRDRQRDDRVKSLLFAEWSASYLEPSGMLLAAGDVERALAITERWRARALLERLDRAAATRALGAALPLREQRDAALDRIAEVQLGLLDPAVTDEVRQRLLGELARAEADEATLREDLAAADPAFAATRRPDHATLAELRAALAPDEALLSYQLAAERDIHGDPLGGSWVVVLTRDEARAVPLAPRADLDAAIDAFTGLVAQRDGGERAAAAALHRALIAPAFGQRAVPRRLVIIPDGALHRTPFGLLRAAEDRPALAEQAQITTAASATVWLRLREQAVTDARAALVLADPALPAPAAEPAPDRAWALAIGAKLGPLPYARDEGIRVADSVGGKSHVLVGAAASERALKELDLGAYRILHFAAHAIIDEEHPDRSAVVLAPGAPDEDGLLQIRDIVGLDLDGLVVVLSACRSASGSIVRGEGVLGLTGAFLQAGAAAVVGSLWPLRDDEASAFFIDLYAHLALGESVAQAVASAQRAAIRRGAPPEAWAGIVVIGDGAAAPVAAAAPPRPPAYWKTIWALVAAALFAAAVVMLIRTAHSR